jgi:diacylglycerol kinase (ATP)
MTAAAADPSPRQLFADLTRTQKKHRKRVERLGEATAEMERQREKLKKLETRIADLERRLAMPRQRREGEADEADGPLLPALLLFNPSAGSDKQDNAARLATIVSSLRAHGIEARIGLKTSGKALRRLAKDAVADRCPLVIVAAGDGTLQDVAAQVVGSETVLGIVPVGTMNNVARALGIPLEIDDACALIGMGTTRKIDLGRVVADGRAHVEYFFDVAGVGLLAIAAFGSQSAVKRRWRLLPRALRKLVDHEQNRLRVEIDDVVLHPATRLVTVSNCPLMGNNLWCAPDARMDDGLLDVSVYDGMNEAALAAHFVAAATDDPPRVDTWRARHVRIVSDKPLPTNTDMELPPEQPVVEISVVPAALSVIVGNGVALTVPVAAAPSAPVDAKNPPVETGEEKEEEEEA